MNEILSEKLKNIPDLPGCYIYKNLNGEILYIGKAKNLRKRVSSYFDRSHNNKITALVSHIEDVEFKITNTEREALILEINLIQEHYPPYNTLLKDDRRYPFIEITKEKHPRVISVRKADKKYKKLYGPYPDSYVVNQYLEVINRLFKLRKCGSFTNKKCLYYDLDQCLGPCINVVDEIVYDEQIRQIDMFLKGKTDYKKRLEENMLLASDKQLYEEANVYKKLLFGMRALKEKQIVELHDRDNIDVLGYVSDADNIAINLLIYRSGMLLNSVTDIIERQIDDTESIIDYLVKYYSHSTVPDYLIGSLDDNYNVISEMFEIKLQTPIAGKKKDLIVLSCKNAKNSLDEHYQLLTARKSSKVAVLNSLKQLLNMEKLTRIELFDNSHFNGDSAIGAMVVYKNMEKAKNEYRKYKIESDNTKDDLANMRNVVYRRLYRLLTDQSLERPDLIIADGGIEQVKVIHSLVSDMMLDIKVIGLSKDNKHQTNSLVLTDGSSIDLDKKSDLGIALTLMQDEVHRYAISFHRKKMISSTLVSILDSIKGLGSKKKESLLTVYQSITEIKDAKEEAIAMLLGKTVAKNLFIALQKID